MLDGNTPNTHISDRRRIKDMLEKQDLLSVNQTSAQIKLTEAWKASLDTDYPVKMKRDPHKETKNERTLRPGMKKEMEEGGRTKVAQESFTREARRLWNRAPEKNKTDKNIDKCENCNKRILQNNAYFGQERQK